MQKQKQNKEKSKDIGTQELLARIVELEKILSICVVYNSVLARKNLVLPSEIEEERIRLKAL